jgi:hypothetical protein
MSARPGANTGSSGRKCPLDLAQMSARPGTNVRSTRRGRSGARLRLARIRSTNEITRTQGRVGEHSCPLERTFLPTRASFLAHSTQLSWPVDWSHLRPLERTFLPTQRNILGRSTRHLRPLEPAFAPTQTCMCTHSTRHLRPLEPAFAPTRRDICAHSTEVSSSTGTRTSRRGASRGRRLVPRPPRRSRTPAGSPRPRTAAARPARRRSG